MVPNSSVESSFEIITSESEKLQQTIETISKISKKRYLKSVKGIKKTTKKKSVKRSILVEKEAFSL